jgi:hypothetical protein
LNAQLSGRYGWKYQIEPHGRLATHSLGLGTLSLMFRSTVYHGHLLHPQLSSREQYHWQFWYAGLSGVSETAEFFKARRRSFHA